MEEQYDTRTYLPGVPYDKQPYYKIDPHLIILDPETGDPQPLINSGTPQSSGIDIFDVVLW